MYVDTVLNGLERVEKLGEETANEKKKKENYREIVNLTRLFLEISIFTVDAITRMDKNSELKMVENTLEEN